MRRPRRRRQPSRTCTYIALAFILFTIWIWTANILFLHNLPAPISHPSHLAFIISQVSDDGTIHDNAQIEQDFKRDIFLQRLSHYPLPYHTLRNITEYGFTRLIAIGDLHGDLEQATKLLKLCNIIDDSLSWNTSNTILIQTGDIVDRGPNSIEIYKLFNSLRSQAVEYNSLVFQLLGNHEINNLNGRMKHTNQEEIKRNGGESEWNKIFSLENKEIGNRLRNFPIVMIIGNTLFCHAGLRYLLICHLFGIGSSSFYVVL